MTSVVVAAVGLVEALKGLGSRSGSSTGTMPVVYSLPLKHSNTCISSGRKFRALHVQSVLY